MVDSGLRVLVVGAGIAGLATARALRLAGFEPYVVEKLAADVGPGAGLFLPGNGARALRSLGLHEAVRPLGAVITRQRIHAAAGHQLADVDVAQLWGAVGECRGLPRADLHQVLLTGVGGHVRYEVTVTGLEFVNGSAKVSFSDGDVAEYDLVVAADGRRSAVRAMADLGGPARPAGQLAYRSVISGGPDLDAWNLWLAKNSSFLAMPIGQGRVYCYADEIGAELRPPADPLARVRELYGGYGGPVPALLERFERVQVATIEEVELPVWVRGPVALTGDAAHASSPHLAQGAALALEDAHALAEEVTRARDVPQALEAYQARQRPRAAWVLRQARRRDRARGLPVPALRALLRWRAEAIFRSNYGPLMGAP
jgi:2-polyprenyl-6-methoxyphenol hydroxylase-like FAD-dependent oxidoreductase